MAQPRRRVIDLDDLAVVRDAITIKGTQYNLKRHADLSAEDLSAMIKQGEALQGLGAADQATIDESINTIRQFFPAIFWDPLPPDVVQGLELPQMEAAILFFIDRLTEEMEGIRQRVEDVIQRVGAIPTLKEAMSETSTGATSPPDASGSTEDPIP